MYTLYTVMCIAPESEVKRGLSQVFAYFVYYVAYYVLSFLALVDSFLMLHASHDTRFVRTSRWRETYARSVGSKVPEEKWSEILLFFLYILNFSILYVGLWGE